MIFCNGVVSGVYVTDGYIEWRVCDRRVCRAQPWVITVISFILKLIFQLFNIYPENKITRDNEHIEIYPKCVGVDAEISAMLQTNMKEICSGMLKCYIFNV